MSPKRPISSQLTPAAKHVPPHEAPKKVTDAVRDAKRESGPDRGGDDATVPGQGERVVPDLAHHAPSSSVTASTAITTAAARVVGAPDAPKDVFDPNSTLDERAGRAQSERDGLRERARHGLQDDAAKGDGTTGIAEQGTDAIKDAPAGIGLSSGSATVLSPSGEVSARGHTNIADDPDFKDNPIVQLAKGANELTTGRSIREANAVSEDTPVSGGAATNETAPAGTTSTDTPGGVKFTHPDGSTTVVNRDGTEVTKDGTTTTIHRPDGTTTTQSTDASGTTTVVDTAKDGTTTTTEVGSVDDEHQHRVDPEMAALLGLDRFEEKLRGPGVAGGGNTDPVDDDGFGTGAVVGSAVVVGAAGSPLLTGGDTRGSDIGSGGAGNRGVDPGGHAGAIDHGPDADPGFGGGGLEDDPLDNGPGPSRGLDGRTSGSTGTDAETDTSDDIDEGEPTTEAPFRLFDTSPLHTSVLDQVVTFDSDDSTDGGDTDDTDDPNDPND